MREIKRLYCSANFFFQIVCGSSGDGAFGQRGGMCGSEGFPRWKKEAVDLSCDVGLGNFLAIVSSNLAQSC